MDNRTQIQKVCVFVQHTSLWNSTVLQFLVVQWHSSKASDWSLRGVNGPEGRQIVGVKGENYPAFRANVENVSPK